MWVFFLHERARERERSQVCLSLPFTGIDAIVQIVNGWMLFLFSRHTRCMGCGRNGSASFNVRPQRGTFASVFLFNSNRFICFLIVVVVAVVGGGGDVQCFCVVFSVFCVLRFICVHLVRALLHSGRWLNACECNCCASLFKWSNTPSGHQQHIYGMFLFVALVCILGETEYLFYVFGQFRWIYLLTNTVYVYLYIHIFARSLSLSPPLSVCFLHIRLSMAIGTALCWTKAFRAVANDAVAVDVARKPYAGQHRTACRQSLSKFNDKNRTLTIYVFIQQHGKQQQQPDRIKKKISIE